MPGGGTTEGAGCGHGAEGRPARDLRQAAAVPLAIQSAKTLSAILYRWFGCFSTMSFAARRASARGIDDRGALIALASAPARSFECARAMSTSRFMGAAMLNCASRSRPIWASMSGYADSISAAVTADLSSSMQRM